MDSYTGPTELAMVLPEAVFGPILTTPNIGSVGLIGRIISGKMPRPARDTILDCARSLLAHGAA